MSDKPGCVIYFDVLPALEKMDSADAGKLFVAALRYAQYGEVPDLTGSADLVWSFIRSAIDRDSVKYEKKQLQARWKVYCREAKKSSREPLEFEDWLTEEGASKDNLRYQQISKDSCDGVCYQSKPIQTHPKPIPSPTPSPVTYPSQALNGIRAQTAPQSEQLADEAEWNRRRNEAVRKLEEYSRGT